MGKKKRKTQSAASKKPAPPIDRDVGRQSKGPRLQRLRAALFLVEATKLGNATVFYAAVEFEGDVHRASADSSKSEEYHEENKNYDPNVKFTMNSEEVLNFLVTACDCWIGKSLSKQVKFGFYTPNKFAKENRTARSAELGIEWPNEALLQSLVPNQAFAQPLKAVGDRRVG